MGKAIVNVVIVFAVAAWLNFMLPRESQGIMLNGTLIPWCSMFIIPYACWIVGTAKTGSQSEGD
jgi:hypothetical protein